MDTTTRSEPEILADLEQLCQLQGFIHAIAYFCFRDNFIGYSDEIKPADLDKMNDENRLIRTEISLLIGFMVKAPLDLSIPKPQEIQRYIESAEKLLRELHDAMNMEFFDVFKKEGFDPQKDNPFKSAKMLREPIFYAAESAYSFQYSELAIRKYAKDNAWLQANKGFTIEQAAQVIEVITKLQNKKFMKLRVDLLKVHPDLWTLLPTFTFTTDELIKKCKLSPDIVLAVVRAFSVESLPTNAGFKEIGDFNVTNACPFIPIADGQYLACQHYSVVEALYESPFYWLYGDKAYEPIAMKNRGDFTEDFATEKLSVIFGVSRVLKNLRIIDKSGTEVGEIDTLVVYADRAIILQAKSKKLTIPARKGSDNALRKDFQDAIQKAYDQGWSCANFLLDGQHKVIDQAGVEVKVRNDFREIFIICLIADHYPGLSFQADQFLKHHDHSVIRTPYIIDVFLLDVLAEFLTTPLHFLSLTSKRSQYFERLHSSNELIILAYHLSHNLWFKDDINFIQLADDFSQSLDVAMYVRRLGFPGQRTPDGILTKFKGQPFGRLIDYIATEEQDGVLDLGYYLLELGEETALSIGQGLDEITKQARIDGKLHDFVIATGDMGFTAHCSHASPQEMMVRLAGHCRLRKYSQKAKMWFGIAKFAPSKEPFQLATALDYPWEYSEKTEKELAKLEARSKPLKTLTEAIQRRKKPGRNEPCTCGSGIKSKKCCYR